MEQDSQPRALHGINIAEIRSVGTAVNSFGPDIQHSKGLVFSVARRERINAGHLLHLRSRHLVHELQLHQEVFLPLRMTSPAVNTRSDRGRDTQKEGGEGKALANKNSAVVAPHFWGGMKKAKIILHRRCLPQSGPSDEAYLRRSNHTQRATVPPPPVPSEMRGAIAQTAGDT